MPTRLDALYWLHHLPSTTAIQASRRDSELLISWNLGRPDVSTITAHAYGRVIKGDRMPGVFEVNRAVPIRTAIEDIMLVTECSVAGEWEGRSGIYHLVKNLRGIGCTLLLLP